MGYKFGIGYPKISKVEVILVATVLLGVISDSHQCYNLLKQPSNTIPSVLQI